jgi:hypothetical protein
MKTTTTTLAFLFTTSLLLFTACQIAPRPESSETIGKGLFEFPGSSEPVELTYQIIDGNAIWQGDIILGKASDLQGLSAQSIVIDGFGKRWPNATIPFVINANVTASGNTHIQEAIAHWQAKTPIRLRPKTSSDSNYVEFVRGSSATACSSAVGMQGGRQEISLNSRGDCASGVLIHEIGHTVGLLHEQARENRNLYVTIVTQNIEPGFEHNYDRQFADATDIGSYDFLSIMHFNCFEFGKVIDGVTQQVIFPRVTPPVGVSCTATESKRIGQRRTLSAGDIASVNAHYPPSTLAWSQNSFGIADTAETNDRMGQVLATGDFNNDGRDDLAIGIPNESVGSINGAGIVQVFYGASSGVFNTANDQVWHQDSVGIADVAETNDFFGSALAAGDFNNDGFDDLAIGIRNEDTASTINSGAVTVLYGTASGLSSVNSQFWTQDSPGIVDTSESDDRFGSALAVGDFNGNGFDDLAISVPTEDIGTKADAGAVYVLYGSANRLSSDNSQRFTQDSTGIEDEAESGDRFGFALAAGDFDGNGRDDLAIGIPFEDIGLDTDAGAVAVIYGSSTGLSSSNQFMSQDSHNTITTGGSESGDNYGYALAAGDFNSDGRDDLAVGSPGEDFVVSVDAGVVSVIYGTIAGLRPGSAFEAWTQNSTEIEDTIEAGDAFGSSLAAGKLNNDAHADLAIGVYSEDFNSTTINSGAVNIIFGSANRLTSTGDKLITQNTLGLNNASVDTVAESGDLFGAALAIGDFDGNGLGDLAIGVPGEAIGTILGAGMINVVNNF